MHRCKGLWLRLSVLFWRFRCWLQRRLRRDDELVVRLAMFVLVAREVCDPPVSVTAGEQAQALARLRKLARQEF
jgi:hypothetical protein